MKLRPFLFDPGTHFRSQLSGADTFHSKHLGKISKWLQRADACSARVHLRPQTVHPRSVRVHPMPENCCSKIKWVKMISMHLFEAAHSIRRPSMTHFIPASRALASPWLNQICLRLEFLMSALSRVLSERPVSASVDLVATSFGMQSCSYVR